jgi:hypothetical protein
MDNILDDKDFFIVRKNLNILSVLILALAYTNANIEELKIVNVTLDLSGGKAYIGLFTIYAYLTWRYLTKLKWRSGFWNDFDQYYISSDAGVKSRRSFDELKSLFINQNAKLKQLLEPPYNARLSGIDVGRASATHYRSLILNANFYLEKPMEFIGSNFTAKLPVTIPLLYIVRKFLTFSFKHDKFGDYVLPLILVLINFSLFLVLKTWKGGFYALVLM